MEYQEFDGSWPEPGKGDLAVLIAGVVAGHSLQQIADEIGMSVSTVQRRRHDPLVRQAVRAAQVERHRELLGRLGGVRNRALTVLEELLDHDEPAVRLKAANMVLAHSLRYELAQPSETATEPEQESIPENPVAIQLLAEHMSGRAWDVETVCAPGQAPGDDGLIAGADDE